MYWPHLIKTGEIVILRCLKTKLYKYYKFFVNQG